jgi:hypothetical protein
LPAGRQIDDLARVDTDGRPGTGGGVRAWAARKLRLPRQATPGAEVLATLAVTAIGVAGLATGHHVVPVGLMVVGPLVAAIAAPPGVVAGLAAYAIAFALLIAGLDGFIGYAFRLAVLAIVSVASVCIAFHRRTREDKLGRVTQVAEIAQRAILPPVPPVLGPLSFAAAYLPAASEAVVGGDFYGVEKTVHGVRVVMGDARGHGSDAVRLTAATLASFKGAAHACEGLGELAQILDRAIAPLLGDEDFVTALFVEFSPPDVLRVVNCGHPAPLLVGPSNPSPIRTTTPLGLSPEPKLTELCLGPSGRALFYTDGLSEARDDAGRFFPLEQRASEWLATPELAAAVDRVITAVLRHTEGRLADDLAVMAVEWRTPPVPSAT